MVETIWTKLAGPHAGIEPSLRKSSQERNFLLQRPGGEMGSFASIAGTETALTSQFGRHAFENAALLRVSHTLYNYRMWVVGATGIEPVTPSMSTRCSPLSRLRLDRKIVEDQLLAQPTILSRATQDIQKRPQVGPDWDQRSPGKAPHPHSVRIQASRSETDLRTARLLPCSH